MATLATLTLVLTAQSAAFTANLQKAQKGVESLADSSLSLGKTLLGVGAALSTFAAGAGLSELVHQSMEAIDANAKLSDRLGITTESLSGLQYAGKLAGVGTDEVTVGIEKMLKTLGAAKGGSSDAVEAMAAVGVSFKQLQGLTPEQAFGKIADGLSKMRDPAERAKAALDIFGRSGQSLLPLLMKGADGIASAQAEAEKLGITFSRLDAAKVELANESMIRLGATFQGVANTIAIEIAPLIESLSASLVDVSTQGGGVRGKVVDAFEEVTAAIATAADYVELLDAGFKLFRAGATLAVAAVSAQFEGLIDDFVRAAALFGKHIDNPLRGTTAGLVDDAKKLAEEADKAYKSFQSGANAAKAHAFFAGIKADADEAAHHIADMAKKLNDPTGDFGLSKLRTLAAEGLKFAEQFGEKLQDAAEKNWAKLKNDAQGVVDATRTPLEKLNEEREKLERLRGLGLLDDSTFGRAIGDAVQKAREALGVGGPAKGVEALQARSGFTFNAQPELADPLAKIANSAKSTDAVAKQQRDLLNKIYLAMTQGGASLSLTQLLGGATGN